MSQPIVINIGALPNDGTGDPLRTAFNDVNLNFANVFASGPVGSNIQIANNIVSTLNTNGNLVLSPNGIGVVQANSHVVPNQTRIRNLGSANLLWNTTYTQYLNAASATIGTANIGNIGILNIPVANLHISGGDNGYVLQTDGTGNLTWTAQTGGSGNAVPAGANTQIQYNDAGNLGATAGFTFDNVTNELTVPGNITMSLTPSGASNQIKYGLGNLVSYLDGQWTIGEYNGNSYGTEGIRINPGIEGAADVYLPANQNANVEALTVSNYSGNVAINTATGTWTFGADRGTVFPDIAVQRGDNPSGTISGQTLLFGNPNQQAIISTPDGSNASGINSQRLVINPGAGAPGTGGEGGDIYLWAGRGGDVDGNGGDVKIRGGQGMGNGPGGYLRMEAGDTQGNGVPGYIQITGGQGGNTYGGYVDITGGYGATVGGDVKLYGGYGQATGGNVNIWGGASGNGQANEGHVNIETGGNTWTFDATGNLTTPGAVSAVGNIIGGNITTSGIANLDSVRMSQSISWPDYSGSEIYEDGGLVINGPGGVYATGNIAARFEFNDGAGNSSGLYSDIGNSIVYSATNVIVRSNNSSSQTDWTFDTTGNLTLPSTTSNINYSNGISILNDIATTGNFVFDTADLDGTTFDEMALTGTNSGNILINADGLVAVLGAYESDGMVAGTGNVYLFNGDPTFVDGIPQTGVGKIWQFDNNGNLNLPQGGYIGAAGVKGDGTMLTGGTGNIASLTSFYSNVDALNYSSCVTVNADGTLNITTYGDGTGQLGQWQFSDANLSVPGNTTIFTPIATGGAGGNSITIQAGSSDSFASAPGGDLNLIGGYGSFGDGGGPPGGNVNIFSGGSYDSHAGNITINSSFATTWTFDYSGKLTLPTISLGESTDEQTVIQSQRKLIPPFRWSAEITGSTPTVVYTATNVYTTSMKVIMQIQHQSLGMEFFEVNATYSNPDTYYTVSNRLAPPTIDASTVVVNLNGSNTMEITVTINSGAATSWVTYDAVEFGIPQD